MAEYRALFLGGKIAMVGGLEEWMENPPLGPDETVDAWWGIYPRGFLDFAIPEMMGTEMESKEDAKTPGPQTADNTLDGQPISPSDRQGAKSFRTGGLAPRKVLGGVVDAALGYLELEALFAGLPIGERNRYLKGWQHWCMFCDTQNITPRIDTTEANWGESLWDFTMYESQVLHLAPSTTRGKLSAIRYAHIVSG